MRRTIPSATCNGRISKEAIEGSFQINFDEYFRDELARLDEIERDGLIEGVRSRQIKITDTGRIFIRVVANAFDAFQPAQTASKAV